MNPADFCPRREEDCVVTSPDPESAGTVLVRWDDAGNRLFELNRTASFIWERCDGGHSVQQIVTQLCERFDVDPTTARTTVEELLAELMARKLLGRPAPERA